MTMKVRSHYTTLTRAPETSRAISVSTSESTLFSFPIHLSFWTFTSKDGKSKYVHVLLVSISISSGYKSSEISSVAKSLCGTVQIFPWLSKKGKICRFTHLDSIIIDSCRDIIFSLVAFCREARGWILQQSGCLLTRVFEGQAKCQKPVSSTS